MKEQPITLYEPSIPYEGQVGEMLSQRTIRNNDIVSKWIESSSPFMLSQSCSSHSSTPMDDNTFCYDPVNKPHSDSSHTSSKKKLLHRDNTDRFDQCKQIENKDTLSMNLNVESNITERIHRSSSSTGVAHQGNNLTSDPKSQYVCIQ